MTLTPAHSAGFSSVVLAWTTSGDGVALPLIVRVVVRDCDGIFDSDDVGVSDVDSDIDGVQLRVRVLDAVGDRDGVIDGVTVLVGVIVRDGVSDVLGNGGSGVYRPGFSDEPSDTMYWMDGRSDTSAKDPS
jgi:hypothetical protein